MPLLPLRRFSIAPADAPPVAAITLLFSPATPPLRRFFFTYYDIMLIYYVDVIAATYADIRHAYAY